MPNKVTICDPPSGWRYGFPRPVPKEVMGVGGDAFTNWLVECGYPKQEIEKMGDYFFVRFWEEDEKSCEN